ncbi:MAG TPA: serine hydrolase domain-containing protein [Acidimicrobiales bacterium]
MGDVQGTVEPGFERVREAFERNFADHGEVGAACAIYLHGRPVVDLWGGVADPAGDTPYTEDTLQLVFSSTKGATALCASLLAQRGDLDLDAPVARYWPEFAQAGKGDVPVRWLLTHHAGLPYIERVLTLDEALAWDPPVEALAAQAPVWEPGTAHGYHAVTFGWLVGEVVRRVTGRSLGTVFADEVAGPLGLEFWIGLPDRHQERVAPLTNRGVRHGDPHPEQATGMEAEGGRTLAEVIEQFLGPDSLLARALAGTGGVFTTEGVFNRPEVRAAELPAANGVANARSMARMYAAMIGPVDGAGVAPLLTPEQVAVASTPQTSGPDRVLMLETTFGLGFMTSSPFAPYGGAASFGHAGAGGSVGFADPENGLAFGYVMNRMMANLAGDPRSRGLIAAAYDAMGVTPAFV